MTDPFRKTRTAAGYLLLQGNGDATRYERVRRLFTALQACDRALATGDRKPADAIADVLLATADMAGRDWLAANATDPDVRRLRRALCAGRLDGADHVRDAYHGGPNSRHAAVGRTEPAAPAVAELDELLSRVLWARYGPP
jgi:hypothetical protein